MLTLEQRLSNLENLVHALSQKIDNNKFYADADMQGNRQGLSEVNNIIVESVYPSWDSNGYSYFAGEKVSYEDKYYRCIQNHTSQADWTPDTAVSLWVSISDPSEEYPEWVQPTGAHDAYSKGDKVSHNEKHWVSDVDSNVWEPGVYGWSEV